MRSEHIDKMLSKLFLELQFDNEFIEMSAEAYKAINNEKTEYSKSSIEALETELSQLETKELNLAEALSSGIMRQEIYKIKILELENNRTQLKKQLKDIQSKGGVPNVTFERIKNVFIDGNISSEKYLTVGDEEKRSILEKLLSNATVKDQKIVSYQFKSVFQLLANTPKNADLRTRLAVWDDIRTFLIDKSFICINIIKKLNMNPIREYFSGECIPPRAEELKSLFPAMEIESMVANSRSIFSASKKHSVILDFDKKNSIEITIWKGRKILREIIVKSFKEFTYVKSDLDLYLKE